MAERRTRFVLLSDTHNATPNGAFKLPRGDVLIHAGDLTNQGSYKELKKAVEWIEKADFDVKIIIAGNHDITLDTQFYAQNGHYFHNQDPQDSAKCRALLQESSIVWLQHESRVIQLNAVDGPRTRFKIFGSPFSPAKGRWGFSYTPDEAQRIWDEIPLDADIVLTHTPPYAHCDESREKVAAGCEVLRNALWKVRPRLAVCGHVHEGRGAEVVEWNLSSATDAPMERRTIPWTDPAQDNNRLSLIDLTRRRGQRLQNDGSVSDDILRGSGSARSSSSSSSLKGKVDPENNLPCTGSVPPIPPSKLSVASKSLPRHDTSTLSNGEGRRETCIINAAIMASSWPHGQGGKRYNKPIVVDIDLPVWG